MPHVLLTTSSDADERKTVAAVRALARRGACVTVASNERLSPGGWSRGCRHRLLVPCALEDEEAFVAAVLDQVRRRAIDVLLPMSDDTSAPFVRRPTKLREAGVATALPTPAAYEEACDKLALTRRAQHLGLDVPETHAPEDASAVAALAARVRYPCVLKLRRGAAAVGLAFPRTPAELVAAYQRRPRRQDGVVDGSRVLVQEYVPGELHDVGTVCDRGRVVAAVSQQRVVMHPPAGGVGVVNETTDEPEIRALAARILGALAWHGPAQVEFRRDPITRRTVLLEVNGRPWGTLGATIAAGVDVPWLLCQVALGAPLPPDPPPVEAGLRTRWPWPYGLLALTRGPGPRSAWRNFFRPAPATRSDLSLMDPLPHGIGAWRYLRRRLRTPRGGPA